MTASVFLVRSGQYSLANDPDTGLPRLGAGEPDIFAHVARRGWHVDWEITAGPTGEPLAWGRTWTVAGARVEAIRVAHRPGLPRGAR